jgi:hypothetical protein
MVAHIIRLEGSLSMTCFLNSRTTDWRRIDKKENRYELYH